jgi:hypothetical protein
MPKGSDDGGVFPAEIDDISLEKPLDAVQHAENPVHLFRSDGLLNDARKARIDNRGRPPGLADDQIPFTHTYLLQEYPSRT